MPEIMTTTGEKHSPPSITLVTGQQLAQRLTEWIPALQAGQIPRCAGLEIAAGLDAALLEQRRQAALWAIWDALDPERVMTPWKASFSMAERLKKLDSVALRRIESGHRLPTRIESLLLEWMALSRVRCQEPIYQEIMRLGR